jgi:3-hydroxyisobutyrate dehydrogenase-like beta-hydroxyacid dehydrogenase
VSERVGLIGVGKMGTALAERLLASGYEVLLRDVDDAAVRPFANREGADVCESPREIADSAAVVLLSLPFPSTVREVALGSGGLVEASQRPLVIDLSTSGVPTSRSVAAALLEAGFAFLDAPVSGGVGAAIAGRLSVMAAGGAEAYARSRPLLSTIGAQVFFVGAEPGQAQAMKVVNNMLSAVALVATSEAMALSTKAGIAPETAIGVLNASSGRNSATEDKFPKSVLTGTFDFGFELHHFLKDVKLFEALAEELDVPTIVCEAAVNVIRIAVSQGLGDEDFTAIARLFERWAGVEIRSSSFSGHGS